MSGIAVDRHFVTTSRGTVHIATCGDGLPVLLLHQTPRSWDEYRDVLPLLGRHVRAIAMDTPGFGDSPLTLGSAPSIESWAETALALLDTLGIGRACLVGHHTGAVIALEAAARAPERVAAVVLSSCPMVDAVRRQAYAGKSPPVDVALRTADGQHLLALWRQRRPYYPAEDSDLLDRFMIDALKAGPMAEEGHRVVNRYEMEHQVPRVKAPALVIGATADPHAFPSARRVSAALSDVTLVEIGGGMVPLPDQMPRAFSEAILTFLAGIGA